MTARTVLGLTAALMLTATATVRASNPVPQSFRSLKPYQVVEQVMAQRTYLGLTEQQFARLDELSIAIRTERHHFTHRGGKPHTTRHVPMVTRQQAYERALTILTSAQQARLADQFQVVATPERAPRRPITPHGKP